MAAAVYKIAMLLEANQLDRYYQRPDGAAVRRAIARRIGQIWPQPRRDRVLGYGFALPYLRRLAAEAERTAVLMPAQMGVPDRRPANVALGQDDALPFADSFFDRILVVHALEGADSARALLRQLWRVLAPDGRILIVAPNRVSLWAMSERSPFACGRPWRRSELDHLLREALFEPLTWDRALHLPPHLIGRPRTVLWREGVSRRLFSCFAGVHLVEAGKTLYGVAPLREVKKAQSVLVGASSLRMP